MIQLPFHVTLRSAPLGSAVTLAHLAQTFLAPRRNPILQHHNSPLHCIALAAMDLASLKSAAANLTLYDLKAGVRKVQNGKIPIDANCPNPLLTNI